eukprot:gene10033-13490_t
MSDLDDLKDAEVITKKLKMSDDITEEIKKIRMVALDLDGTLLDSHHNISELNCKVLRELHERGIIICIASGRSIANVKGFIERLDIDDMPVIVFNGSFGYVHKKQSGLQKVFGFPMTVESTNKIIQLANEHEFCLQYYNGDTGDVYAVPKTEQHHTYLGYYAHLVGKPQKLISSYDEAVSITRPAKLLIFTPDSISLIEEARNRFGDEFDLIKGGPNPGMKDSYFVEFNTNGIAKDYGLHHMCQSLGVGMDEVVSFGDGNNDCQLLKASGLGVAMKNATQLAKESANVVLEWTNDEDGVALYLQQMLDEGKFAGL